MLYDGHYQTLWRVPMKLPRMWVEEPMRNRVENAFRILVSDDAVKAILVVFGGIMMM